MDDDSKLPKDIDPGRDPQEDDDEKQRMEEFFFGKAKPPAQGSAEVKEEFRTLNDQEFMDALKSI